MEHVEMYHYELILPGLERRSAEVTPRYGREKSLGPVQVGERLTFPDAAEGDLILPQVEWEVERIEQSAVLDARLVLRRPE